MSASAETLCVAPGRLPEMWPHVEVALASAVTRCGDWTLQEIYDAISAGSMLLWVLWTGEKLSAAAVTRLSEVPRGKVCTVIACGGKSAGSWQAAIAPIEAYAAQEGCSAMRIYGRVAWAKIFPDYDLAWVALEKGLR